MSSPPKIYSTVGKVFDKVGMRRGEVFGNRFDVNKLRARA